MSQKVSELALLPQSAQTALAESDFYYRGLFDYVDAVANGVETPLSRELAAVYLKMTQSFPELLPNSPSFPPELCKRVIKS